MDKDDSLKPLLLESLNRIKELEKKFEKQVEPIAIIGIGCRFPGESNDPESYWNALAEGKDCTSEVPLSRWNIEEYYDPDPEQPGKIIARRAGFLSEDVALFDPEFFGISPKESEFLDPQQRLLLEVLQEALENAGIASKEIAGALVSVFTGISWNEYGELTESSTIKDMYPFTGTASSVASGRLSFIFDFQGPNAAVETACSSSLVAVHEACQTLHSGEADLAIAGGVNLMLTPRPFILVSEAGMLSPDGYCKTFDASADGMGRGEGCGLIILKRLSDALRDNDRIVAVIEGSGINHDGRSIGLTAPSSRSQERLLKNVCERARVSPSDVDYIETHGTGTSLGDPIEVSAIKKVYGKRDKKHPLVLGSVKSNIGHLESAAGIASLIKAALALHNEKIPPNLHFKKLNPEISLNFPSEIITELKDWKRGDRVRRAAVSSFGFSGTNAHVVLREAPTSKKESLNVKERPLYILALSAKTMPALSELVEKYIHYLEKSDASLPNMCFTANTGRNHEKYRAAFIAKDVTELKSKLKAFKSLEEVEPARGRDKIAFDFTESGGHQLHENGKVTIGPKTNWEELLTWLSEKYTSGATIDWKGFDGRYSREKVVLPTYPFQRKTYWSKSAKSFSRVRISSLHPLLGELHTTPDGKSVFFNDLTLSRETYLKDHQVYKNVVFPGTGYLEMLLGAGFYGLGNGVIQLTNVDIEAALGIAKGQTVKTQIILSPAEDYEATIYSEAEESSDWHRHAKGFIRLVDGVSLPNHLDLDTIKARCNQEIERALFYKTLDDRGLNYGEHFQGINHLAIHEDGDKQEGFVELKIEDSTKEYLAHPALLDSCLQTILAFSIGKDGKEAYMPIGCEEVTFYAPLGSEVVAYFQKMDHTEDGIKADFTLCTPNGEVLLSLKGMNFRKTTEKTLKQMLQSEQKIAHWIFEWCWEECALEGDLESEASGNWLILSDGELTSGLIGKMKASQQKLTVVQKEDHPESKEGFRELITKEKYTGIVHVASTGEFDKLSKESIQNAQRFGAKSLLYLAQALAEIEDAQNMNIYLITQQITKENTADSPMMAMHKTLLLEHPQLSIKLLDVNQQVDFDVLMRAINSEQDESIFRIENERCFVPRLLKSKDAKRKRHELVRPEDDLFQLQITEKGVLENLTLAPCKVKDTLDPYEVEADIHAVGLNFRDVLNALDLYPGDPGPLGGDAAGVVTRVGEKVENCKPGDFVLGIFGSGAFARRAYAHCNNITVKPGNLDAAEAASLPGVFLTVFYAFTKCIKLTKDQTVLIHAGTGGVGQAAIQVAKHIGAKIIATAGSEKKREYLKAQGVEAVFDSRSLSYGSDIEAYTNGKGVDAVLNCLSGKGFIETSLSVCRQGAAFLEIGKRDIWTKEQMKENRPDIDYHIIAIDDMFMNSPEKIQEMYKEMMPLFSSGALKAPPVTCFPIEQAINAFEYMYAAKQIGKVVITQPPLETLRKIIDPNGTYLITGGLGGLGQTLATWLIDEGATNIVLTGRSELKKESKTQLQELKKDKSQVRYEVLDVSEEQSVKELLLKLTHDEKPLKGIFHLAGVLDDAVLDEQDWDHFEKVFLPKVYGSFYLHKHSKDLDLFVMFSSIASSFGNPGQINYAAANGFMDSLSFYRRSKGLPAISLSWGPWAEVGMAKELISRHTKSGMIGLKPKEGMLAMETALLSNQPHMTIAHMNWENYLKQQIGVPTWFETFSKGKTSEANLLDKLESVEADKRFEVVKAFVADTLRVVLGIPASQALDEKKGFFDMGLDSLMVTELKNRLQAKLGKAAILPTTAVFDNASVEKMSTFIGSLLKLESITVKKRVQRTIAVDSSDPIAIIGMGCRLPGGANNPESFWSLLESGYDAISEVPPERWDADMYYDPDPEAPGKMITKLGGFLKEDVSLFDAPFFKISPKEAEFLDPQQRLLLEVSYEAICSAGIEPSSLEGSLTGVFMGMCSRDYMDLITASGDLSVINPYIATGNAASTATGRLSYFYGLEGPNFAVDTACSSSLVAIDNACESLRSGESNLALAGGVNLILAPNLTIDFSKAGMLAPDGHCKTFDASANGYARGEGCGIIVLKRLSDAKRDGDNILATIKASGVNQDGASSGLTVPNGGAQEALLSSVLKKSSLKPEEIDYVEAHGTGTALGDPIEIRAIGSVYGKREKSNPLLVSSVKTNIGHLEGAAGIAGVIKVVLSLLHEKIPAHRNFTTLNPHIELNFPAKIPTSVESWKKGERVRRAAVSSFGFSGTNAHLIIEESQQEVSKNHIEKQLIPTHEFTRKRYWSDIATLSLLGIRAGLTPLLGNKINLGEGEVLFEHTLSSKVLHFLPHDEQKNVDVFTAGAFIELLVSAGKEVLKKDQFKMLNVVFDKELLLNRSDLYSLQLLFKNDAARVRSMNKTLQEWVNHVEADYDSNPASVDIIDVADLEKTCCESIDLPETSEVIEVSKSSDNKHLIAELEIAENITGYCYHPLLIQSGLDLVQLLVPGVSISKCEEVNIYQFLKKTILVHIEILESDMNSPVCNIRFFDDSGKVYLELKKVFLSLE